MWPMSPFVVGYEPEAGAKRGEVKKRKKRKKMIQTVASRVSVLAGTLCVRGSQAAASYDESSLGHCLWASTAAFSSRGASAVPMAVSARR